MKADIRVWAPEGHPFEPEVMQQVYNIADVPVVEHVRLMPDGHHGIGGPVGGVIQTKGAVIPALVGVDIGCGMMATKVNVSIDELDGKLPKLRAEIENTIPVGGPGEKGSWKDTPALVSNDWTEYLEDGYKEVLRAAPLVRPAHHPSRQLGTLGTGNHFIEVCVDSGSQVWLLLHSGSRGIGNRIGSYFIEVARELALKSDRHLPDRDLAWLDDDSVAFKQYTHAVSWAQTFARMNRERMMLYAHLALETVLGRYVYTRGKAINCHHNYVEELGGGQWLTRKGAVNASYGVLGIIPGSMGAKSFIVRGKGSAESLNSCSHGAGRRMSRGAAKRAFTVEQHVAATEGVECRKDQSVIDETPGAYKDIEAVMAAQADLVSVVATLKQVVCVKG